MAIKIERDCLPIAAADLAPTYLTTQPNGPGCSPVCHHADATMAVAAR